MAALALSGCQPNSGGMGTGSANTLGSADDGDSDPTGGPTGGPGPSPADAGDDPDPDGGQDSTGGPPPATSGPPPATGGDPSGPMLVFDEGSTCAFGDVPIDVPTKATFVVRNKGDAPATGMQGQPLADAFAYTGGAYPGTTGTCGNTLDPGSSCELDLTFTPDTLGLFDGVLSIDHDDGPAAECALQGGGDGSSDNLVVNPSGDDTNSNTPPGWTAISGPWGAGVFDEEDWPLSAPNYIYAGSELSLTEYELHQDIDVSPWATTIDAGVLQLSFEGYARAANLSDDPHEIKLHYLDAGGASTGGSYESGQRYSSAWQSYGEDGPVPPETRTVRIELNCNRWFGVTCNAYFDSFDLHVSYP